MLCCQGGVALQLVFSCRILGMGVEQWVYAELGYPEIEVVGEVATELNTTDKPEWINMPEAAEEDDTSAAGEEASQRVIVYGTCPLRPIWAYLQPKLPNSKFAAIVPAPCVCNLAVAKRENEETKQKWLEEVSDFNAQYSFDMDVYSEETDGILITLLYDPDKYKYTSKTTDSYFYANKLDETNSLASVLKEYTEAKVTYEDIYNEISYICENLASNTKLFILTAAEVVFGSKDENYEKRIKLNELAEKLAKKYSCIYLLDIRKYAKTTADFFEPMPQHYNRMIGYLLAKEVLQYLGVDQETKRTGNILKSSTEPSDKALREEIKVKNFPDSFGKCTTWLNNSSFHVNLDLTNTDYDYRYRIWRDRYIVFTSELTQDTSIVIRVAKPGRWRIELQFFDKKSNKKVGGFKSAPIDFSRYNYIEYYDSAYDDYEAAKGGVNQFCKDDLARHNETAAIIKQISELAAMGVNFADFFLWAGIEEISVFADEDLLDVMMPFLYHSSIRVKNIFTTDNRRQQGVDGDTILYPIHDINTLTLSKEDVVLFAYNEINKDIIKVVSDKQVKLYMMRYVLGYMMTKTCFVNKYRENNPMVLAVRTPNLRPNAGFSTKIFLSNEKVLFDSLKNDGVVYTQIKNHYDDLPPQYHVIPQEELLETMKKPTFCKKAGTELYELNDVKGKYLNIENGFRKTSGQPEKYVGTIYIFGGSHAFGCGVKDSETIASYLQEIIGLPYRVENYANCWGLKDYSRALMLMNSMKFRKNDIIVFIMANYERPERHNRKYHWLTWEALDKPIIKVDSLPLFQKVDRPDYIMHAGSYNAACNFELAKMIQKAIYDNI